MLTLVQSIFPPTGFEGKRFGSALAIGDFDGDDVLDLAVGAPEDNASAGTGPGYSAEGVVFVYRGDAAAAPGTAKVHTTAPAPLELRGDVGGADEFGFALAAGEAFPHDLGNGPEVDRDALVVGSPGAYSGDGEVYAFLLDPVTPGVPSSPLYVLDQRKADNAPTTPLPYSNGRLGHAVAVGNYVNQDSIGGMDTRIARFDEIAAGAPEAVGGDGRVLVFQARSDGPDFEVFSKEQAGRYGWIRGYGSALGTGFVHRAGWEDLVIGAPATSDPGPDDGYGESTFAETTNPNPSCTESIGTWEGIDSAGNTVRFRTMTTAGGLGSVQFLDTTVLHLEDCSSGTCATCISAETGGPVPWFLPGGFATRLPGGLTCPGDCNPDPFANLAVGDDLDEIMESSGAYAAFEAELVADGSYSQFDIDVALAALNTGTLNTELDVILTAASPTATCNVSGSAELELDVNIIASSGSLLDQMATWDAGITTDCQPQPLRGARLGGGIAEEQCE